MCIFTGFVVLLIPMNHTDSYKLASFQVQCRECLALHFVGKTKA